MLTPSTLGNHLAPPGEKSSAPFDGSAMSTSLIVLPRRQESVPAASLPSQVRALVKASPCFLASTGVIPEGAAQAPLSMIARLKRPALFGETR